MRCPYCSSTRTKVVDKRLAEDYKINRRRRECEKCGKRFTTFEKVETTDLIVIKKDGRRERFDREKMTKSILKACEKLPVSYNNIKKAVDSIENEIKNMNKPEVRSKLIGDLVMKHLRELNEVAYVRFASYYKHFTDVESFQKELKVVRQKDSQDSTDISLMVATPSKGDVSPWDKERIVKALIEEAKMKKKDATKIADAIEKKVFGSGMKEISVGLIRELINNELFMNGYKEKLKKQEVLGMPIYNVDQIIFDKSKENSNITANNPEAVNLAIAENTLKLYALNKIFSSDVASAHLTGAVHLHNLGFCTRVYCSAHSLEYIKKYGLRLLNLSTASGPAKHAMTLTGHLNTFLASMQAYYAGALGIAYVNIFYAPLLVGKTAKELKQEAQYLIFSCSQNAFSRGGQTLFIDFNLHLGVPEYLKEVPAIGQKGKYMLRKKDGTIEYLDEVKRNREGKLVQPKKGRILTYGDFEKESQGFAKAMLEVWKDGDVEGKPFPFPKCDLHVSKESFEKPDQLELLKFACQIAGENGSPYFVFDRDDGATLSQCCRLRTKIKDQRMLTHPESMRFCGFQNVTINLPQAAYRAKGDLEKTIKEIHKTMEIAMKAHLQKKRFVDKLMVSPGTPMWQLGMPSADGRPYLDLRKATYIIGILGLNDCVNFLTSKEMHESEESYKLGLDIIAAMNLKVKEFEKKYRLTVALEETPAESASLRLAKIDLQKYPESKNIVKGNPETGEIFYTNSVHFAPDAPIDITERIEKQGKFNPLVESGAITHVFLGEQKPDPEAIFNLIKKTFDNTPSMQICISPEFTICNECKRVSRGYMREAQVATNGGVNDG